MFLRLKLDSGFLDDLCSILYENLRPQILKETHIDTLSNLCSILQSNMNLKLNVSSGEDKTAIEHSLDRILHDAQSRLVFRAQVFLRTEIQGFQPTPDVLDYPAILKSNLQFFLK